MSTRALITGASGFCARHLAKRLLGVNTVEVFGLDVRTSSPPGMPANRYLASDLSTLRDACVAVDWAEPDWVFHLAGMTTGTDDALRASNLASTSHLLEAISRRRPDAKVLVIGSAAEYGLVDQECLPASEDTPCHPVTTYGLTKNEATRMAIDYWQRTGIRVTAARPFNIVGAGTPRSLLVGAVIERIITAVTGQAAVSGEALLIKVGRTDTRRDFIAVQDVVGAYIDLMNSDCWGEVVNICSGTPTLVSDVIEQLISFSPVPIRYETDPALLRAGDPESFYGSFQKALLRFGFQPRVPLDNALREAWDAAFQEVH